MPGAAHHLQGAAQRGHPIPHVGDPEASSAVLAGSHALARIGDLQTKIAALLGALSAVLLFSTAASATTTNTIHLSGVPIDVGPAGCVPGDLVMSGNGVLHETVNNAGDFWITGTIEGPATVSDPVTGSVLFSGHAAAWFGSEENAFNSVQHFIANSEGTLADGTTLGIHQEGQFTLNAKGIPVVARVTVTCH